MSTDRSQEGYIAPANVTDRANAQLAALLRDVSELLIRLTDAESAWSKRLADVAPEHLPSAGNLVHYWAIRQGDLRELQHELAIYGLSSLGRCEPHVQATLLAVRSAIAAMLNGGWKPPGPAAVGFNEGLELLEQRTVELLGPRPHDRVTRIMVTLPSSAATDPAMVSDLVQRGMNIARINCAHDDPEAWRAMARHVRQAAESTGTPCLIAMDLAGPKLRTGPLQPGPRSIKLRPRRNILGQVLAPARAWLTAAGEPSEPPEAGMPSLPVPHQWLSRRKSGDVLHLRDTRGSKRRLVLDGHDQTVPASGGFVATANKTTYLATGTKLDVEGQDEPTELGDLPRNRAEPRAAPRRHSRADPGLLARPGRG